MTSVRSGSGPESARIMVVGECWGENEERTGEPFIGPSGQELNRMLNEAGILRSECYVTNVVNARPANNDLDSWIAKKAADRTTNHYLFHGKWVRPIVQEGYASLRKEIEIVKPRLIIAMGGLALWAVTEEEGIQRWRGSLMWLDGVEGGVRVVPTYHPSAILRQWDWRSDAIRDLDRAAQELKAYSSPPPRQFLIDRDYDAILWKLSYLLTRLERDDGLLWLDFDLETARGHITRCGVSWSRTEAMSIPFLWDGKPAWDRDQEALIIWNLYRIFTHPKVRTRWQNGLYDAQYTYRHWLFIPRHGQDTMISQHTLWSGKRKSLDYQASMYAEYYTQWKPEKGAWKEGG